MSMYIRLRWNCGSVRMRKLSFLFEIIRNTISHREFYPGSSGDRRKEEMIPPVPKHTPEPFEIRRRGQDAFFEKMKQTSASPLTVQEENLLQSRLQQKRKQILPKSQ